MAKSYAILLFCVFIWAGNYLVRQFLLIELNPLFLSAFSLSVISIFFIMVSFITKSFVKVKPREMVLLGGAAVIGLVANQVFLFTGLTYSSAANASLIFSLSPIITAFLAGVFLKEKITTRMIIGSLIAIVGIYLVLSVKGQVVFNIGDLLLFGGAVTFSCNLIFVRLLSKRLSTLIITTYSFILSAVIFDPFILAGTSVEWNQTFSLWVFAALSVIIGQGITSLMWNQAMNDVGAAKAAIVLNLQPLMTMLLDYLIYNTLITALQMFGVVLVFTGILLSTIQMGMFFKNRTIPGNLMVKNNDTKKM
ncbi:DMT family transporter [Bacillus litorisediminis]|uniref:DMT family transporter n=1 Tax=Bacillus litorisediminis TaxID=2922713 RepID=UPI001FAF8D01|nr:DMT family transporter [Bacillus litorisediminis]